MSDAGLVNMRGAGGLARFRHEVVSHAYALRRYARSGWWAGVPQQGAGG
jgi:hypothetical protein